MKRNKLYYLALLIPMLISTFVILFLLEDSVPAHYGANNMVDRWGSKYEMFLLPTLILLFGAIMLWYIHRSQKKELEIRKLKSLRLTFITQAFFFNVLNAIILYCAYYKVEDLNEISGNSIIGLSVGIVLLIVGNYMPKTRNNAFFGLRTIWSRKNDITWKESQQFGAISLVVGGLLIILVSILSFFIKGINIMLSVIAILLITAVFDVIYTYFIAKKYP